MSRQWIITLLVVGLVLPVNLIAFMLVFKTDISGEAAGQILAGAFGALSGIIGSYTGFRASIVSVKAGGSITNGNANIEEGSDDIL